MGVSSKRESPSIFIAKESCKNNHTEQLYSKYKALIWGTIYYLLFNSTIKCRGEIHLNQKYGSYRVLSNVISFVLKEMELMDIMTTVKLIIVMYVTDRIIIF